MVRNEGRGKSKSMCMRTWDSKVYWQTTCRMWVSGGGELLRGGGHPGMEDGNILGRGER